MKLSRQTFLGPVTGYLLWQLLQLLATAAPPASGPVPAELERYAALWERPLFEVPAPPSPAPLPPPVEESPEVANLRLAGWGTKDGVEMAVAFNCMTLRTFVLRAADKAEDSESMRLLELEQGEGPRPPRALVEWRGRAFWIAPMEPVAEAKTIRPALVVDSRAADLRAPVLFTEKATMENWIEHAAPRTSSEPSRVEELRERHRRLQKLFGH